MPTPLIPVKRLADGKRRLGPALNPVFRRLLVIAMFEDVVAALQATPGLERPVVVTPDREMWQRAEAIGCRVVEEPPGTGEDLNASLTRVVGHGEWPGGVLVVAADLPLATPEDFARVTDAMAEHAVVVVPSRDGDGTNVLGWRDPVSFAPAYGPGSAGRHLGAADAVRVEAEGLGMDADTPSDLRAILPALGPASVTGRRARDLKLAGLLETDQGSR